MFELHEHIEKIPTYEELEKLKKCGKVLNADVSPARLGQKPDSVLDMTSYPPEVRKLGGLVIDAKAAQAYTIGAVISYYHQENPDAEKKLLIKAYLFEHSLSPYAKYLPNKH